jgi:threonine dehydrogenase-like Zn-dependent dehydrogenase
VLECVGSKPALEMALDVVRDGGAISRVGLPQYTEGPLGADLVLRYITITGGATPARAYIEELLPDVLEGRIEPGPGVRSHRHLDQGPRRIPRHGRPRSPEGAHPALSDRPRGNMPARALAWHREQPTEHRPMARY